MYLFINLLRFIRSSGCDWEENGTKLSSLFLTGLLFTVLSAARREPW